MENKLIVINAQEFGLEKTEAQKIEAVFTPMLEKMVELEKEYNEVVALEISDEAVKKARELRLKYVKVRTGTEKIHEIAKAYYLAGGRFVDAWKNAQKFSAIGKETELEKIEKHFELIEEERKNKTNAERVERLSKFIPDTSIYNVKEMSDEAFAKLLETSEIAYISIKEAEERAEKERLEKEKAEKVEQERIKKENETLKKEAEAREKALAKERAEQEKKLEAERNKAKAEAEAREKAEKELKDKKEADEKSKREAEAKQEAEKLEKQKLAKEERYKTFLKENDYNDKTKHLFHIERVGNEVKLYKIINTFNIE